jgi:hypothetical protein
LNDIGDEGASALADALKVNTTVTKLNLSYNHIAFQGALALFSALDTNTSVTEIFSGIPSFAGIRITDGDCHESLNELTFRNMRL